MTKTKRCHECKHYAMYGWSDLTREPCKKLHKPRFYMPRNGNPYDPLSGYRRKCDDFEPKRNLAKSIEDSKSKKSIVKYKPY